MKSKSLLLIVVLSQLTCHQVIFHAPPGTTMGCVANPEAIAAFNGVSVISCILQEETGTPVADGTVVQFFTNLGRVPEQGKTNDGVVRVNLQADGRSGRAHVTVISGGGTIPSSTNSTVTTLPLPLRGASELSASSGASSSSSSALMADASVDVTIGNLSASDMLVTANPTRIIESRSSQITAAVFDSAGNPVAGVPVVFTLGDAEIIGPAPTPTPSGTATPGPTPTPKATATPTGPVGPDPTFEHMDSQGAPIFTDSNGRATDVLRTRYPRDAPQRAVRVNAIVPGVGITDFVRVIIN